jgi:hypothetical protein
MAIGADGRSEWLVYAGALKRDGNRSAQRVWRPRSQCSTGMSRKHSIQTLIRALAESECEFSRNGSLHSAETAAEHIKLKYSRGKRYADSAKAFIDRLARKSCWSGEPYQLICDGETQPVGDWLKIRLEALRSQ